MLDAIKSTNEPKTYQFNYNPRLARRYVQGTGPVSGGDNGLNLV